MGKKSSIARRYFVSVSTVVLGSMILLASIFFTIATQYFRTENLNNLRLALSSVSRVIEVVDKNITDREMHDSIISHSIELAAEVSNAGAIVADTDGNIIFSTSSLELSGSSLPAEMVGAMSSGEEYCQVSDLGGLLSKRYSVVGQQYVSSGSNSWFVIALSDAGRFAGYLSDLIFSFLWASILMLLVSAIVALLTAQRISAPLNEISKVADRFGKGDFSARVSVAKAGNDEITQLAQNFNTMANGLEAMDRSRQSFMGNIAHELRTPMTSIKGFIDGMLDGVIKPEKYHTYLSLVSDEVARLTRLIQSMLDITKLEAGEYAVNAKNYDIWETIGAVLLNNEQRLADGHIGIIGFVPQRTLVYADPDLISQVVYNIVDNAIKFTPAGGSITLSVSSGKDRVYVSVRNTGTGVPAEQLPYLFDRFYKGDQSRGLHASGAGLGMHISKVLIGVSGGSIYVNSDSATWTEFGFDLPMGLPELPPPRRQREGKSNMIKFRGKRNN